MMAPIWSLKSLARLKVVLDGGTQVFHSSLSRCSRHVYLSVVEIHIGEKENRVFNLKRGWADPICVRRPWRRRGVAHALIMRSLRLFANMGLTEAALGVDTENTSGALRVYESCGFRPVSRSVTMRKTMALGD